MPEDLDLETFYFDYPSLRDLVKHMSQAHLPGSEYILLERECQLVMSNGVEYLDDFTSVSCVKLHAWTGIPMGKLRALYGSAEAMIKDFHGGKVKEIGEIQEFRIAR
jgi:hypothetical protein